MAKSILTGQQRPVDAPGERQFEIRALAPCLNDLQAKTASEDAIHGRIRPGISGQDGPRRREEEGDVEGEAANLMPRPPERSCRGVLRGNHA